MSEDKFFADIYVHLRPDSSSIDREEVEKELCNSDGVFTVHFDKDNERDAMLVSYNPMSVSPEALLEIIRKSFTSAVRVASMKTRVIG